MNKIKQWGLWARCNNPNLNSKSAWLITIGDNLPKHTIHYDITDDEAIAIDKAAARLGRYSMLLWQVLCLRYLKGWSCNKIAKDFLTPLQYGNNKKKRVYHDEVVVILAQAEGYIMGVIDKNI